MAIGERIKMKKLVLAPLFFVAFMIGCSQQARTTNTPSPSDGRIAYQMGMTLSEAQSLVKVSESQAISAARATLNSLDSIASSRLAGIDGFLGWDVKLGQQRAFVDASDAGLVKFSASIIFGLEDDSGSDDNEIEEDELHGVIIGLDEIAKTFTLILSGTSYTIEYSSASVEGNLANDVNVEAEGTLTGTTLVATEVEVEEPEYEGSVSNLDATAKTFTLTTATESLTVDYSNAAVEGTLIDGATVEVEGSLNGTTLTATKINIEDPSDDSEDDEPGEDDDLTAPENSSNL